MAVTELAAHAAISPYGQPRAMLLAADDYSAVSGRVPLSNLYERGRSLGIGVQVSAQSWQGLGADDDERYRIAATADGGIFVLHTPYPEPLTQLAGTRRVLETAHKLVGNSWGDEGTTREQRAWTADPDLIRRLDVGQACYIHRGAATFVQVARPKPSPLTLLPPPALAAGAAGRTPPRGRVGPVAVPGHPGPGRFLPSWSRLMNPDPLPPNPFAVLGLPEWPELEDETVHAAWQQIADQTHPGRPDGGDLARFTHATAAYYELSCPWGRTEAYADLVEQAQREGRWDAYPDRYPPGYGLSSNPASPIPVEVVLGPVPLAEVLHLLAEIPARFRCGHPWRLAIRALVIAGLCLAVLTFVPRWAFPHLGVAALIGLFALSAREDMAPAARPVRRSSPAGKN